MKKAVSPMTLTMNQMRQFGEYFLDDLLRWIEETFDITDVFYEDDLKLWALDNGFVRKEENDAD